MKGTHTLMKLKIFGILRRSNQGKNATILAFGTRRAVRSPPKVAERSIKTTKSLGPAYLLNSISSEIQLRKKLTESFGKDGDLILAIAMSKILHPTALHDVHNVLDDSFLPEMYAIKESFSSQWISDFLARLASKEAAMTSFYNSLIAGEDGSLIFDITSLSSSSRNIDWLEWGYNRDGLDLPQVNLGLV